MFRTITKTHTALAATAIAAALALPGVASAETPPYAPPMTYTAPCAESYDTAGPYFDVKLCNVSDIDQKRASLPGDGGTHCGPASLFNSLHYLARRKGMPSEFDLFTGTTKLADINPHDPNHYSIGSYWIWRLGSESAWNNGTKMDNLQTAFKKAAAPATAAGWTVSTGFADSSAKGSDFGQQMATRLRFAPLQLIYGRYDPEAGGDLRRNGGHIVTVTRVRGYVGSDEIKLTLHDPARSADDDPWINGDGNLNTQSPVQDEEVTLKRITYTEVGDSSYQEDNNGVTEGGSGGGGGFWRTITRWQITGDNYKTKPGQLTRGIVEGYNHFWAQKSLNP